MTHQEQGITTDMALKTLEENRLDGMREIYAVIMNEVMKLERTQPSIPLQRCMFHLQQNVQHDCSKQSYREQVCRDVKRIYLRVSPFLVSQGNTGVKFAPAI
jgi:hypothetical protein